MKLPGGWRGQRGQALVESSLVLVLLVGGGLAGGYALMRVHPEWMGALDGAMRSYFFCISLPFP